MYASACNKNLCVMQQRMLESFQHGVVMINPQGMIVYTNHAFENMIDLVADDDVLNQPIEMVLSRLPIQDHETIEQSPDASEQSFQCISEPSSGDIFPLDITNAPLLDEHGTSLGRMITFVNISERTRIESDSEDNKQLAKLALVAGGMGYWEWDLVRSVVTYDAPMAKLYGYPPRSIALDVKKAFEIVHPEDLFHLRRRIAEALKVGNEYQDEFRIHSQKHSTQWIGVRGQIRKNKDGKPVAITGVCFDITKLKVSEAELIEKTEQLNAVINTTIEAIITIDRNGIILSMNKAGEQMFGYTPDELIGRNVNALMPSPHTQEHDQYIQRYLDTGEARIIGKGRELIAKRKDGSLFPIELLVGEIDHLQKFTGLIRDISERRQIEKQLTRAERLNSIGTLAAGLGHDMNNILLPVRARLDLIQRSDLSETVRDQINEIRKSTNYLQDLADSLHHLVLDPEDGDASDTYTDLKSWWDHSHTLLSRSLPKNVSFSSSIQQDLPLIKIAPHRLTQAILNLLVNSGKAVNNTDGRVWIRAEADPESQVVRVRVADNGCGMSKEVQSRVFEPFFTTKTRGIGTGLGLTLVHTIINSVDGIIEIESEPGKGTELILSIPYAASNDESQDATEDENRVHGIVTVVDPRMKSLTENLLELAGANIDDKSQINQLGVDGCIWVTDMTDSNSHRIQRALDNGCRVITLGDCDCDIKNPNLTILNDTDDYVSLRSAIQTAMQGVSQ